VNVKDEPMNADVPVKEEPNALPPLAQEYLQYQNQPEQQEQQQ